MVKDINHVKRILSGVMLLLAIAIVTAAVVIYVTQSTSVLLHLALPVMFSVMAAVLFIKSRMEAGRSRLIMKYLSFAIGLVSLGWLALFVV